MLLLLACVGLAAAWQARCNVDSPLFLQRYRFTKCSYARNLSFGAAGRFLAGDGWGSTTCEYARAPIATTKFVNKMRFDASYEKYWTNDGRSGCCYHPRRMSRQKVVERDGFSMAADVMQEYYVYCTEDILNKLGNERTW